MTISSDCSECQLGILFVKPLVNPSQLQTQPSTGKSTSVDGPPISRWTSYLSRHLVRSPREFFKSSAKPAPSVLYHKYLLNPLPPNRKVQSHRQLVESLARERFAVFSQRPRFPTRPRRRTASSKPLRALHESQLNWFATSPVSFPR